MQGKTELIVALPSESSSDSPFYRVKAKVFQFADRKNPADRSNGWGGERPGVASLLSNCSQEGPSCHKKK
jgi:hypothetical protein